MNFTNEHIKFGTQHIMNLVYTSYKNETFNEASKRGRVGERGSFERFEI